nr:hypothetical protein [uncultured Psychroserpens sp.]
MKRAVLVFIVLCFISCKEAKNEKELKNTHKEQKELIITLGLKTDTEDVFKIVMDNIIIDEFQKKNIVIRETLPVISNFENITANFGANNFSNNIHINLGKQTKTVKFNSIEITYGGKVLTINSDNFNEYLRVNKFVEFNKIDFNIVTKKVDKNHNPQIILKPSALKLLNKKS